MPDYKKIKELLGTKVDTEDQPYNTYNNMVDTLYNEVLQDTADDFKEVVMGNVGYDVAPGSRSRIQDPFLKKLNVPVNEAMDNLESQRKFYTKDENTVHDRFYTTDRYELYDKLFEKILEIEHPEILNNYKYSDHYNMEPTFFQKDTAEAIRNFLYPKLKKDLEDNTNPDIKGSPKQIFDYFKKDGKKYGKYGEAVLTEPTYMEGALGHYVYRNDEENPSEEYVPGNITLSDKLISPQNIAATLAHELSHSLYPHSGGEENLLNLQENPDVPIGKKLSDINNNHLDTGYRKSMIPGNEDINMNKEAWKSRREGKPEPPSGESVIYHSLLKQFLKDSKK